MAFCSSCGGQLEGNERFCVKCGADQTAHTAGVPPAVAAAPQLAIPSQPAQPFAGVPPQYPPQQPVPPFAGMPPQYPAQYPPPPAAPAKSSKWIWIVIVVGAVAGGGYYYNQHRQQQNPGPTPAPQTQPGAPTPQSQPGPQTPPGAPGPQAQPGAPAPGQGGANQALVAQQHFVGRWDPVNGYVQISQAQWQNGSNVTMQSATLACMQYAASGQTITQQQTTLNGPAQPGQIITIPTFQMGQMAQGLAKVNCGIVGVTPAQ